jgi:hypothetical protein
MHSTSHVVVLNLWNGGILSGTFLHSISHKSGFQRWFGSKLDGSLKVHTIMQRKESQIWLGPNEGGLPQGLSPPA